MKSLSVKIKKRTKMTVDNFSSDSQISYTLAFCRLADDLLSRIGLKKLSGYFHKKKENWISLYLENLLADIILKYKDDNYTGEFSMEQPIWVCWWTGEETAPELVKQCIKSIRKQAKDHPVVLINQDNYIEYLNIPDYIINKLNDKHMGIANFTDYLRFALLDKYGGIWLDSTIFVKESLPDSYFEESLFTCKSPEIDGGYVSRYRWTSFCFAGWKHNVLFRFFKDSFQQYWKNHNAAIDYLFVDHLIDIAYRNISSVKEQIDNVPINNIHRDDLQAAMNAALPASSFNDIISSDTVLYKLSWRETYSEIAVNDEKSVYKHFLNLDF